jgi:hypothetical protein
MSTDVSLEIECTVSSALDLKTACLEARLNGSAVRHKHQPMVTILLAYEDLELFPNSNARYFELEGR